MQGLKPFVIFMSTVAIKAKFSKENEQRLLSYRSEI